SAATTWLRRLAPLSPLVPRRVRSCFVEGAEFFAAVEAERSCDAPSGAAGPGRPGRAVDRRERAYTVLGANLSWCEVLSRHHSASAGARLATATARVLSWLLIGQVIALVIELLAPRVASARPWCVHALKPRCLRELLSLCHRRNIEHVKVVGYNNGVNHF